MILTLDHALDEKQGAHGLSWQGFPLRGCECEWRFNTATETARTDARVCVPWSSLFKEVVTNIIRGCPHGMPPKNREVDKLSHFSGRSPEREINYETMRETGSDQLMELASDLATYIGCEGPTHDIPGTRYIQLPTVCDVREVVYGRGPESSARARKRPRKRQHAGQCSCGAAERSQHP